VKLIHLSIFNENMDDEDEPAAKIFEKPAAAAAPAAPVSKTAPGKQSQSKKRVKFGEGQEDEDVEIEDDFQAPSGGANVGVVTRRSAAPTSSKKMKVDEDQEVSDLFASSIRFDASPIDLSVKKFVYRLISEVQN
jgi:hypothetical protein